MYILGCLFSLGIAAGWDMYNLSIIDKEIIKIVKSESIDSNVYAYEKFGIVERELKKYYVDFYENKKMYEENEAGYIFSQLTNTYLQENKDELKDLLKDLPSRKIRVEKAIQNIVNLMSEEVIMERIQKSELEGFYEDIYRDYVFNSEKSYFQNLKFKNEEKMMYLERLLEILLISPSVWYIEDGTLYFIDSNYLKEYQNLYDLITETERKSDFF